MALGERLNASSPRRHARRAAIDRAELFHQVYDMADLSAYTATDRWLIKGAGLLFYGLIAFIGRTVRWTIVDWHHYEALRRSGRRIIYAFWHNRVFLATWFWRRRGIVVMTSPSFDGEYIARFIQRFGYGAARGSSGRAASRAFRQMAACLDSGLDVAFTIDGPRGPRYVAKPGAVRLAMRTGAAILPFHISAEHYWEVESWDRFQIPRPFTRAVILLGRPICVPMEGSPLEIAGRQTELQATLDDLRRRGDRWWTR